MPAKRKDFICEQGTDWVRVLTLRQKSTAPGRQGAPLNLTNYHARMMVRSSFDGEILASIDDVSGGIVIDPLLGKITLKLTNLQTGSMQTKGLPIRLVTEVAGTSDSDNITYTCPTAIYDLEIVDGDGEVSRLLYGEFGIPAEVTK